MSLIKSEKDIEALRQAGKILARVLDEIKKHVRPGVKKSELDQLAEKLIRQYGCEPSFKGYQSTTGDPPFPTTLCVSANDEVVHAPALEGELQSGDIVGVDAGLKMPAHGREYFVDMAKTFAVGKVPARVKKLLAVTQHALDLGIAQAHPGNSVADIGKAIQAYVEPEGFSIVRSLVGHGVGHAVHEEPRVPNFYQPEMEEFKLQAGMVIAIEPMVNVGGFKVKVKPDGWTIVTSDGTLSAHFEHTIVVTEKGPEILTRI
jgi:methionyl aminopeptidase